MGYLAFACGSKPQKEESQGETIVERAIAYHGGSVYNAVDLSFRFRGRDYGVHRSEGQFAYMSSHRDSLGLHTRWLNNEGYREELNGTPLEVSSEDSAARAASVNSVIYFALLPGMLNTPAARMEFLGEEILDEKPYYKIEVTFSEEGGGEDFDDVFLYWFSKDNYAMDYLAYSYLEEEGGTRFRKAYDRRKVNGLVFQDYVNYKGPAPDSLDFISELYKVKSLDTLSLIEVDNLRVDPIENQ